MQIIKKIKNKNIFNSQISDAIANSSNNKLHSIIPIIYLATRLVIRFFLNFYCTVCLGEASYSQVIAWEKPHTPRSST